MFTPMKNTTTSSIPYEVSAKFSSQELEYWKSLSDLRRADLLDETRGFLTYKDLHEREDWKLVEEGSSRNHALSLAIRIAYERDHRRPRSGRFV